jgi:TPP-dependent 2-oxoacid decarboxylase
MLVGLLFSNSQYCQVAGSQVEKLSLLLVAGFPDTQIKFEFAALAHFLVEPGVRPDPVFCA